MKALIPLFFVLFSLEAYSQSVSGQIKDENGLPLPGANVYIEGTFDGASTDSNGVFMFEFESADSLFLIVEYLGFENERRVIDTNSTTNKFDIILKEKFNLLNAVTITAGNYGSGNVQSTVVMSSLDVVTTAGSLGDLNAAMRTLPGTSNNGESGKLFVHGGEGTETGTYIDGIYVHQPYTSSAPNMAVRGRFNPFMFSGTSFSTGGYSAEYGQALSSILTLNTKDMPLEDQLDFSIMSIGLDAAGTKKWDKGAITATVNYMNLKPYMSIIPQNYDWNKEPVAYGGSMNFRQKTKGIGILKVYASADQSNLSQYQIGLDGSSNTVDVNVENQNQFINTNWRGAISRKTFVTVGASFTHNLDNYLQGEKELNQKLIGNHVKATFKYHVNEKTSLRAGIENNYTSFSQTYSKTTVELDSSSSYTDNVSAIFVEGQVYTSPKFLFNVGLRAERVHYINKNTLSPRVSAAYKLSENTSLSIAYGMFYQNPIPEQLLNRSYLKNEQAQHFILSFEKKIESRLIKTEIYYKKYNDLVKYNDPFNNNGDGYAYGLDIFFKDSKSIKNGSYWISYSFLQSERDFRYYPHRATPTFTVTHSLSIVYKHWISKWRSYVGGSFRFASPRVYNDLNSKEFNKAKLPSFASLDINWSYLHKQNIILYASVTNVLGFNQIYGYQYSPIPDSSGYYASTPILPPAKRFIFIGCFITITKKGEANQLDKINL